MDRKAIIREYKDTHRPMGVYLIKNTVNGKDKLNPYGDKGYNKTPTSATYPLRRSGPGYRWGFGLMRGHD